MKTVCYDQTHNYNIGGGIHQCIVETSNAMETSVVSLCFFASKVSIKMIKIQYDDYFSL